MKIKIIASTLIFTLSATMCLGGCSNTTKAEEETTAPTIADVSYGEFEYEEVCQHIVINGKQYTFPFSVADLGEGYSVKNLKYDDDEIDEYSNSAEADLYYNGTDIATLSFEYISGNERLDKNFDISQKPIDSLEQCDFLDEINGNYIEVKGLKVGDNKNNATGLFGVPKRITSLYYDKVGSYLYGPSLGLISEALTVNYIDDKIVYISLNHKGVSSNFNMTDEVKEKGKELYSDYDFDAVEICNDIEIDGNKFSFPFAVADLGDDFSLGGTSFSDDKNLSGTYSAFGSLFYKGEDTLSLIYTDTEETLENRESTDYSTRKITHFSQSNLSDQEIPYYVFVSGIKIGDDSHKITEALGTPTESYFLGNQGDYIYRCPEHKNISVQFGFTDNTIRYIYFTETKTMY